MKALLYILFFSLSLFASSITITLPVTHSEPLYREITKRIPYQECYDKEERVAVPEYYEDNSIGLDTLIGITAGVALGNQIGKGNGRDAARVIGGLAGGLISHGMRDDYRNVRYENRVRRVCETHYETSTSKRLIGYRLCAEISGKEVCTTKKERQGFIDLYISAY